MNKKEVNYKMNSTITPISFQVESDFNKILMVINTEKNIQTVEMTYPQVVTLISEVEELRNYLSNKKSVSPVDFFHPEKKQINQDKENQGTVTISSDLYQNYKYLQVDNDKLKLENKLLKKKLATYDEKGDESTAVTKPKLSVLAKLKRIFEQR